jgi:hypothetical protein
MKLYNNTILLPNLIVLNDLLNNDNIDDTYLCNCKNIFENKIIIKHWIKNKVNSIRIWRIKTIFGFYYNNFGFEGKNFIGALDYIINDKYILIDYLSINDSEKSYMYNNSLDQYEAEDLINSLINFIKIIAKKENKNKIIMNIHQNLRYYEKYYYYNGFKITNRIYKYNPFFTEIEFNL